MIKNIDTQILHIVKSSSYNSDGRLQKWVNNLSKRNLYSEIFIVEDANVDSVEVNGSFKIVRKSLRFRKLFKQRRGYFFKVIEYFFQTEWFISQSKTETQAIVFHDVQQYLNIFYNLIFNSKRSHKIIWDLHELPHSILIKNYYAKKILRYILNRSDIIVYTNKERRNYIHRTVGGVREKKFFILNNYPEKEFISSPKKALVINKFDGTPYVLWLGAGTKGRNFESFLEAYATISNRFNLVVLGKIDSDLRSVIDLLNLQNKMYNDFVDQSELIKYIDGAAFSVVLYNQLSMNNYLCEPNRLYQLVARHIPVVVGNNPTMKNFIEETKGGVVLADDGSSSLELIKGIQLLLDNYDDFVSLDSREELFSWEKQIDDIIDYISKS